MPVYRRMRNLSLFCLYFVDRVSLTSRGDEEFILILSVFCRRVSLTSRGG